MIGKPSTKLMENQVFLRALTLCSIFLVSPAWAGPCAQGANLASNINCQGANLQGAKLNGANLAGVNLQGANLTAANLEGANLQGAYLEGVSMGGEPCWRELGRRDFVTRGFSKCQPARRRFGGCNPGGSVHERGISTRCQLGGGMPTGGIADGR